MSRKGCAINAVLEVFRADREFRPNNFKGFTLIEVMMVIALMGIIATLAVSGYSTYFDNARRADGIAVLEEARQGMERFYAKNFSYTGAVADVDYPRKSPKDGADLYYVMRVDVADGGQDYSITAVAQGQQLDDDCGDLTITRVGVQSNGGGLDNEDCF